MSEQKNGLFYSWGQAQAYENELWAAHGVRMEWFKDEISEMTLNLQCNDALGPK
jgi:hypothetical protein